mmetsp:Transcript_21172/g.20852  ORF Transcript_21172/g.20852 Transcript_21172/m.20852 type:complete len:126 (-) Transcript_21172:163-540(-)
MRNKQRIVREAPTPEVKLSPTIQKVRPKARPHHQTLEEHSQDVNEKQKISPVDTRDDFTKQFMIQSKIRQVKVESSDGNLGSRRGSKRSSISSFKTRMRDMSNNSSLNSPHNWSFSKAINVLVTK